MSFSVRRLSEPKSAKSWAAVLTGALTIAQPLVHWYGQWKKKHEQEMKQKRRITFLKRFLLIAIAVFFVLLLLGGIAKALMSIQNLSVTNLIAITGTEIQTDDNGYTNILLIGQGDADHDGKDLTDTIMVASIDPEGTKSVILLSLPRDLYFLKTEKMGAGRINSMYRDYKGYLRFQEGMEEKNASKEAIKELADEIGRKLDLQMHYAVKVDFIGFVRAVDVLGGVAVDVPYDIEDQEYPDENFGFEPFILKKGLRHLDGETALKYARSRHTSSDFGRSARQQQLLKALAEQAREEGVLTDPSAITSLIKIMSENVETTMTIREMISLAEKAQELEQSRVVTMQLNDRNALYDSFIEPGGFLYTPPRNLFEGASVLLPVSIPEFPVTWKQIRTFKKLLFEMRTPYITKPRIAVLNAGARPGSARKLATELIRYGFDVSQIANASIDKIDQTILTVPSENDTDLGTFFSTLLQLPLAPVPKAIPANELEQITIIIGRDFTYTPLQDLLPSSN